MPNSSQPPHIHRGNQHLAHQAERRKSLPDNARPLRDPAAYRQLLDRYDTFLFDCDGVIWTGPAGNVLTDDIVETLDLLRSEGKKLAFITNNATRSRQDYVDKFAGFGIKVSIDEVFTCGSATAEYLRSTVLPSIKDPSKRGIYLIGQKAMEDEFEAEGLKWKGGTDPEDDVLLPPQDFSSIQPDPSIGVVAYSFQMRINYKQLAKAYCYLSSNPGCRFVLTNDDQSFLLPSGGYCPGEGAIASVLYGALQKGSEKIVVGKPNQPLLDVVQRELGFDPKKTIFVGDRLETDVLFAKRGGIDSVLVWTGISKPEDLVGLPVEQEPEYTLSHVGALLEAKRAQNGTAQ
ncbi:hypothetical protein Rhopal_002274-T1 [Rhodotorula paludigena]|uniref:4-nitrophenylphosphatase n=1 Tax=Rhodotorula paludigena TaxID=86838 RepID=A0AAV5GHD3_9BASI|nr:hypothetical protein Rhopal_002274-T1 [Rhodotorula paludigena]